jgi:uncharacterized membrane protein YidH (DUF202 family)
LNDAIFSGLLKRGVITKDDFRDAIETSSATGRRLEELLKDKGVPKHEILTSLAEYYGCPFIEFDEGIVVSSAIICRIDPERLKTEEWFPLSVEQGMAEVIACCPDSEELKAEIQKTLNVDRIGFRVALSSDLRRIIEHNQDINPGFPASSSRTQLARVRTFLANRRTMLSSYRTSLAKGRTGLSFLRTGLSFITIAILLFKIFGLGYSSLIELALLLAGAVMAVDGLIWYVPVRGIAKKGLSRIIPHPSGGTSVLTVSDPEGWYYFARTAPVEGAEELRSRWNDLSPVQRRRFLANDRTDLAEERTLLAYFRTLMAKARTGLALSRTGIALTGVGIALFRHVHAGKWNVFDVSLTLTGLVMIVEGLYWYIPGRRAGKESLTSQASAENKRGIWDYILPPVHRQPEYTNFYQGRPPVLPGQTPGVWGTTGLALERTVLAERRNVMARLRTTMARSRTGLGFVRTGMNFMAVGIGLLVSFGASNAAWTAFETGILAAGLLLVADGLYWHLPAEKIRKQFPYCFGEMEVAMPDYTRPTCFWKKVFFNHAHDE